MPDLLRNQPRTFGSPKGQFSPPQVKEAQRSRATPPKVESPPLAALKKEPPLTQKAPSPPKRENPSPPKRQDSIKTAPPAKKVETETALPPVPVPAPATAPTPTPAFKINRIDCKGEENKIAPKTVKKEVASAKEVPNKVEKLSMANEQVGKAAGESSPEPNKSEAEKKDKNGDESNGVGDKIKKFEKAAEDASATTAGRMSRAGSVRGRPRTERLGSDGKDDLPPPATPFKDNVHFELSTPSTVEKAATVLERQQSLTRNSNANLSKWQRTDSNETEKVKPEPQKIIKPEFKPIVSPGEVTIRSPSLGAKLPDQFPSHGTAFRNVGVASPDPARTAAQKLNDDVNTQNNVKACKFKNKEKYSVSKGSSYFTRGSEEIWLVKKKDIEEIEERVLDSFRRAGGNMCMRSESMRPSSDSGQGASFTHATMGRNKRQMYARSESLDPQWAGARSQTLKRQSSVACTCGHDKKTRAKSAGAETAAAAAARPRSRSHGDDNNQAHVLDKYETLV